MSDFTDLVRQVQNGTLTQSQAMQIARARKSAGHRQLDNGSSMLRMFKAFVELVESVDEYGNERGWPK